MMLIVDNNVVENNLKFWKLILLTKVDLNNKPQINDNN